jgi:hypothetical protein
MKEFVIVTKDGVNHRIMSTSYMLAESILIKSGKYTLQDITATYSKVGHFMLGRR